MNPSSTAGPSCGVARAETRRARESVCARVESIVVRSRRGVVRCASIRAEWGSRRAGRRNYLDRFLEIWLWTVPLARLRLSDFFKHIAVIHGVVGDRPALQAATKSSRRRGNRKCILFEITFLDLDRMGAQRLPEGGGGVKYRHASASKSRIPKVSRVALFSLIFRCDR